MCTKVALLALRSLKSLLFCTALIISVFFIFFAFNADAISSAQDLPALFQPVIDAPRVAQAPSPAAADRMRVSPDFSLIDPDQNPVAAIAAAIPGKTVVLLRNNIKKRGANNYTWFGKVDGYELSTVVLTVVDSVMQGHMNMIGESYSITPDNGGYLIIKNDPAWARPFDEEVLGPPSLYAAATREAQEITTLADDGSVIDVLALYTQKMQTHYGAGLGAKIQLFIDLANAAYANSGISTSLRLAHSALYNDAGAAEGVLINDALNYITTDALAIIGPLRNTYNADLVSLLRVYQDTPSCGLAWIMQTVSSAFASYAFSVVEVRSSSECTSCSYCDDTSFAHELGHNMGCLHDRIYAGTTAGAYPYSYGYGGVTASFLDSLATNNPCYGSVSNPCNLRTDHEFGTIMSNLRPTITYFSTPFVTYSGGPIGISGGADGNSNSTSSADNARTINNTRTTVANFRVSSDTTPPTDGNLTATPGNGQISLSWTAASDSGGLNLTNTYKVVRSTVGTPSTQCASGTQVYMGSGISTTDTGLTNGTTYYYRVCAYDNAGNISTGAPASATLPVRITVTTSPSGLQFTVDATPYTTPQTYVWNPGAGHMIATTSPQSGTTGTQYAFSSWTDGGAQNHSITPAADGTYTANFTTQYKLTLSASGSGAINPICSGGCWYNSGASVGVLASSNSGSIFSSWGGDCSGTSPSMTAVMDIPRSCTATFTACADNPAKNVISGISYASIGGPTGAYANASNEDTIRLLATELTETLNLNSNISVTLSGGWNCGFAGQTSYSIIHGSLTIGKDSLAVIAEKLILY
jgi:hypothetical protein